MIRINLLPARRAKLRVSTSEPGTRDFAIGVAALVGAAAVVFFAVDQPKRSHLHDLRDSSDQLQEAIQQKQKELAGPPSYDLLKKQTDEASERAQAINRLLNAKVVPANVLHELGQILTAGHDPTLTAEMTQLVGNGPNSNPNRRYDAQWDPGHVWLTSFEDKNGDFTLEGGAQAEADVTQLSKRLQASVYFVNVAPSREERVSDRDTGISYYHFTITGKVAY